MLVLLVLLSAALVAAAEVVLFVSSWAPTFPVNAPPPSTKTESEALFELFTGMLLLGVEEMLSVLARIFVAVVVFVVAVTWSGIQGEVVIADGTLLTLLMAVDTM